MSKTRSTSHKAKDNASEKDKENIPEKYPQKRAYRRKILLETKPVEKVIEGDGKKNNIKRQYRKKERKENMPQESIRIKKRVYRKKKSDDSIVTESSFQKEPKEDIKINPDHKFEGNLELISKPITLPVGVSDKPHDQIDPQDAPKEKLNHKQYPITPRDKICYYVYKAQQHKIKKLKAQVEELQNEINTKNQMSATPQVASFKLHPESNQTYVMPQQGVGLYQLPPTIGSSSTPVFGQQHVGLPVSDVLTQPYYPPLYPQLYCNYAFHF